MFDLNQFSLNYVDLSGIKLIFNESKNSHLYFREICLFPKFFPSLSFYTDTFF